MRLDKFSEFSYGYAITEEFMIHYIRKHGREYVLSPTFPTLVQEGRSGGHDVALNKPGEPVFLQFKRPDVMTKNNAKEIQEGHFPDTPVYRMHIRSSAASDQHSLLQELERSHPKTFYVSPCFHQSHELDEYYTRRMVRQNSLFLRPSEIGDLPDERPHHIAYKYGRNFVFCSEPRPLNFKRYGDEFEDFVYSESNLVDRPLLRDDIFDVSEKMSDVLNKFKLKPRERPEWQARPDPAEQALAKVADTAFTYFSCQLYFLQAV